MGRLINTGFWFFFYCLLPQSCVGKVLDVLSSYNSAVGRLAGFQSCSQFVSKVKQAIHNLHRDIRTCVKLRGDHKKVCSGIHISTSVQWKIYFSISDFKNPHIFFWFYRSPTSAMNTVSPSLDGSRLCCATTPWTDFSPSPSSPLVSLLLGIRLITHKAQLRDACREQQIFSVRWHEAVNCPSIVCLITLIKAFSGWLCTCVTVFVLWFLPCMCETYFLQI